jgi:hypothetical protein
MAEDARQTVEVTDTGQWDEFVRTATGGTVFSTSAWLECAEEAIGNPVRIYGCYHKGNLVAGVTGIERKRGPFRFFTTPDLCPHGGFMYAPVASESPARRESEHSAATKVLVEFLTRRYDSVQLTHAPDVVDMRDFIWSDWDVQPRYTYYIPLGNPEAIWNRVERRVRTVIRKAEKEGCRLRQIEDMGLLRRQYELIYAGQPGGPPVSSETVARFAAAAQQRGLTETQLVESASGEPASIVTFVKGFDCLHAWVAGADPAFRDSGATSLLYWKYLEQAGSPSFDFAGANMPGIALFKRGFGGELAPYFATQRTDSRLLKAGVAARNLLRH